MPDVFTDHYGMTISTSNPEAAARWQAGLDRLLSQNAGPDTKFQEAIDLDHNLAIAHGCLAFLYMQRARPDDAKACIQRALALVSSQTSNVTCRERQQIEVTNLWIQGQGLEALKQLKDHLAEFPRDALMMRLAHLLYNRGCSSIGEPNFPPAFLELLHGCATQCEDNWAFLAEYAWAHHENGLIEEAMRLAQRSLALHPTNAVAAHSVAHVYFERGEAAEGATFLETWLAGFDCPASAYVHLSWHLALFELALGQYQKAIQRYEQDIRPYVMAKSMATLPDGASFLWRVQLYAGDRASHPEMPPWEDVRQLALPMAEKPGFAFVVAHAAFALAASDDDEGLRQMIGHLEQAAEPANGFVRDIVLPLVQGIADFARGDYALAAQRLGPVCPQLVRIGGSHAQREVFEDTLLEAHVRAGQFEQAQAMLDERLARRVCPRDVFWRGRVQMGQGQRESARASFDDAAQSWRLGDASSPEMMALNRLAAATN